MRHLAGDTLRKEAIVDLGRPQTPRKTVDSCMEVGLSPSTSGVRNEAISSALFSGDGQLGQQAGAPVAGSIGLLSSGGGAASMGQAVELSSVVINMNGQVCAKVNLADVRRQLMTMGLFPPDLYGVGESFEEMRLRYCSVCFFMGILSVTRLVASVICPAEGEDVVRRPENRTNSLTLRTIRSRVRLAGQS